MQFFRKPYQSDVTEFINELKAQRPQLEEEQRRGRNLLWDRAVDWKAQAELRAGRVPQQPYVYYSAKR